MKFQNAFAVIEQAASLDSRLRQNVGPHDVQNLAVCERVGHFQGQRRAEVLRHAAGNLLHTDSARRHQQIHAVGVALFDDTRNLRLIAVVGFFVEVAVIVNDNQNRGVVPSVMIHRVGETGAGITRLPFVKNPVHHREKLGHSVGFHVLFVQIPAHVRRVGEHGQHFRAEIQTVDVQQIRGIRRHERIRDRLRERGFARRDRANEQMMSALREVQRNRELRLIGRVVGPADNRAEMETARLFGPLFAVENGAAETVHGIEVEVFGKDGKPQFPDFLCPLLLGHAAQIIHDHFQLRLAPHFRQTSASGGLLFHNARHALFLFAVGLPVKLNEVLKAGVVERGFLKLRLNGMEFLIERVAELLLFHEIETAVRDVRAEFSFRRFQNLDERSDPVTFHHFFALSLGAVSGEVHLARHTEHLRDKQTSAPEFLVIGRARPAALEQFKDFVVADLQVTASGLRQIRGLHAVQHVHRVLTVLHAQAETELTVRPDVFVDRAGRPLRGQNHVHA